MESENDAGTGHTKTRVRVVDFYAYKSTLDGPQYLLMRRSTEVVYAGEWRIVGGKIADDSEPAWKTGLREAEEETGQTPSPFWCVPTVNTFYDWRTGVLNLVPAFAGELFEDPVLNHEHDAFDWLSFREALQRLKWPEHQRILGVVDEILRGHGILPDWIVPDSQDD